jgi:hypothetical protein
VNGRDVSRFAQLVAPHYVNRNPYAEAGLIGVQRIFAAILAGVPDLRATAEDVFASADGSRIVGATPTLARIGAPSSATLRPATASPCARSISGA